MTNEKQPKMRQKLLEDADKPKVPMYQNILIAAGIVSMLNKDDFQRVHMGTVLRRLVGAVSVILDGLIIGRKDEFSNSRLFGINQSLHLAASVALLVGDIKLTEGRRFVTAKGLVSLTGADAETLITVATLRLLLHMATLVPLTELPEVDRKLTRIDNRVPKDVFNKDAWPNCLKKYLEQANWIIGENAVKVLELHKTPVMLEE